MHRLFLVPEVVAVIVKSGSLHQGFLHTCLLINHVFFQESARLLWYACGVSNWEEIVPDHATSDIKDLISVKRNDPERAQMYANFVQVLQFGPWLQPMESQWHIELLWLEFPQLKRVKFAVSDDYKILNTEPFMAQFALPNVTDFCIVKASQISDRFLDTLSSKCPKLRYLELGDCPTV
ncbi:unnamed protein product [Clonostachys rosea]|uniref:F-box domain-containing protein n=1 Tax=Bionectria ochroleuca TaxID=29856 RepID=A0ABY6UD73_BIOOC|nr:unnamed protein product [Clonostachys rosea]